MLWYGGRISLLIGGISTLLSTLIAVMVGTVSGLVPEWLDALLMRLTELILCIPSLLIIVLAQSFLGKATVFSISLSIGVTSWTGIAKVVRAEVRQLQASEYVVASKSMGAGFFHILRRHLLPNFMSSILFMVIMNVRNAIAMEAALSFIGLGLPLEIISWGSILSLSQQSLLAGAWWITLIPGIYLIVTLYCMTRVGEYLRRNLNQEYRNL